MINTIINLLKKYRMLISYGIFGVLSTIINIAAYYLCYTMAGIPNVPSTIIAWVAAVIFAFLTNKVFVFESKSFSPEIFWREAVQFFGCRLLTGIMDVVIMFVAVDLMAWNSLVWKVISNVLVIILNYVASKLIIFKKK